MSQVLQKFVDELMGSGLFCNASILALDGSSRATSNGFTLREGEGLAIVEQISKPQNVITSVTVAGELYTVSKVYDERSIYAQKGDTSGVVIVKTWETVLLALYNELEESMDLEDIYEIVEQVANFIMLKEDRECAQ
eukprot:gene3707-4271_t